MRRASKRKEPDAALTVAFRILGDVMGRNMNTNLISFFMQLELFRKFESAKDVCSILFSERNQLSIARSSRMNGLDRKIPAIRYFVHGLKYTLLPFVRKLRCLDVHKPAQSVRTFHSVHSQEENYYSNATDISMQNGGNRVELLRILMEENTTIRQELETKEETIQALGSSLEKAREDIAFLRNNLACVSLQIVENLCRRRARKNLQLLFRKT